MEKFESIFEEKIPKETIEEWYEQAKKISSTEELKKFIDEILDKDHDYNSIAGAFIAGLTATMKAMDRHPNGGITGFQAGWILMTHMGRELLINGPWKIVKYRDMLFPQHRDKFLPSLSKETWDWLQEEAKKNLEKEGSAHPDVKKHWEDIVAGNIPFGMWVDK